MDAARPSIKNEEDLSPLAQVDPLRPDAPVDISPLVDPGAQQPTKSESVMERLERRRHDQVAKETALLCPIPSWDGDLVGKFTLLSKAEKAQYKGATENPPHGLSKEEQGRRQALLLIAMQCRELTFEGDPVEGDTHIGGGFTTEFGARLGAKPAKPGRELSVTDIVWSAIGARDEPLYALTRVLAKWASNPSPRDLSDADPFGPA